MHHLFVLWAHFILTQPRVKDLLNDDLGILKEINLSKKMIVDRMAADLEYLLSR